MSKFMDEKNNTYNSVSKVLKDGSKIYEDYIPLKVLVDEFYVETKQLTANLQIGMDAKGKLDANKNAKFEFMEKLAVRYGRKALAWATKNKNVDAIKVYDITKTDFKASGTLKITLASSVLAQLKTDVSNLAEYRIKKAEIDELETAITEAQLFSSDPKNKQLHGVEANRANRALIKTIDSKLDSMEDLIVGEYEETESTFVNLFLSARHISNLGSRKTKLILTVIDKTGKPLADAYADVLEMENEEQYSDENGELTIVGIKNGTYTLEVSKDGAKTSQKFTIKLGEQLKLKVVL